MGHFVVGESGGKLDDVDVLNVVRSLGGVRDTGDDAGTLDAGESADGRPKQLDLARRTQVVDVGNDHDVGGRRQAERNSQGQAFEV